MERRLSAIFAADMVGYSRLIEADEMGTIERQKAHRKELIDPAFEKYHGRIVKEMGDGVLVEFPSVVEAVQCAAEIQRAMPKREAGIAEDRRITYRIGINLGDIVVDGDDIHGDGVNVAARLESMAEPDGICISGTAYDQMRSTVEVGYESLGEVNVKNIERPIRAYKVLTEPEHAGSLLHKPRRSYDPRHWAAIGLALLLAIGAGSWWWSQQPDFEPADPEKFAFEIPEKPSIAVLPFDNLSGNPDDDYLGDSLTDTIIAGLGSLPDIIVIARNSVFTYKGKPTKVQQVAEELGVRYILEGSIQRDDDRIRVVAQLVDAIDGKHLWAEKYDHKVEDLFDVQDAITEKIAEQLETTLSFGELARQWRKHSGTPENYLRIRRWNEFFQLWNEEGHRKAENELAALQDEVGETGDINLWKGYIFWQKWMLGIDGDRETNLKKAYEYAHKARSMMGENAEGTVYTLLASLDVSALKYASALENANKALELQPSTSTTLAICGFVKAWSGEPQEAVDLLRLAMRLEPQYPVWYPALLAESLAFSGRNKEAKEVAKAVLRLEDDVVEKNWVLNLLVKIEYEAGNEDVAQKYAETLLTKYPLATVSQLAGRVSQIKDKAFARDYAEALRAAGIPEHPPPKLPDKPSIAVLPFDNLSDDAEQEYFVDGLTEDLITRLAKVGGLFVIARNTVFTYKGQSVDVKHVGRDLGVRYVLEGSVRKAGNKLRINAQLIDTQNGGHLWAEIYDRNLDDVFALQDNVTSAITKALKIALTPTEAKRIALAPTNSVKAYDYFLKARELHHGFRPFDRSLNKALELYRAAYNEDPNFADAYAYDASLSALVWRLEWSKVLPVRSARARTLESLEKALAIEPSHALALVTRASLLSANGQHEDAVSLASKAVSLAPNDHRLHQSLAYMLAVSGDAENAKHEMDFAVRLNPNPNPEDSWIAAYAYLHAREYEKSLSFARKTVDQISSSQIGYYVLAAAHARLGHKAEANEAVNALLEIVPFENWRLNLQSTNYMHEEVQAHFVESMKEAGLPEWPYGFEGNDADLLSPDAERGLLWGKRWIGLWKPFGEARFAFDENGSWNARFPQAGFEATGKTIEQNGRHCTTMDGSINRPPSCRLIYRNPSGTPEKQNEYILVDVYGVFEFSAFD